MFENAWSTFDEVLYLEVFDTAIVSDVHLGSSKNINHTKDRLLNKIDIINPEKLIVNGDLYYLHIDEQRKHNYDNIWLDLISCLSNKVNKLVYLEGNHELHVENYKDQIEDMRLDVGRYYEIDDIVITHGHIDVDVEANDYIIGHVHPRKQGKDVYHHKRTEYKNGNLTIMPAFSNHVNGVDINNYNGVCPILGDDTEEYKHLIVENT